MGNASVESVIAAIIRDSEIYIFSISFAFIGAVFLLLYFLVRENVQQFLTFSLLALSTGISLVRLADSFSFFVPNVADLTVDIFSMAFYLMPVGIMGFMESVLDYEPRIRKIIRFFWKAFLVHAGVMGLLDLLNVCSMETTIYGFTIAFILAIFPLFKNKKYASGNVGLEVRIITVGALLSGLTGIFDMVRSILSNGIVVRPIYHWGMMILILAFMLSLMQKFKTTHFLLRDRTIALQQNNASLLEARQELEELNRCLEKRVDERTEQLRNTNEELVAMNDSLTETMTRLTETQAQLVQSEKISAMGTLVAGVTHEINTPIATIKANIQLGEMLYERIDREDPVSMGDFLDQIPPLWKNGIMASDRISGIIQNLKSFARLDEAEVKAVNINEGIESTLTLLNYKLTEKDIQVIRELIPVPQISCFPKQINQLILILLENAIEAISGKGNIRVSSDCVEDCICVSIRDDGCGIAPEHLDRIFDPGFTTKGVGVGTGLGLAIAYKIVEHHRGKITVESEVHKGTCVRVQLPVKK